MCIHRHKNAHTHTSNTHLQDQHSKHYCYFSNSKREAEEEVGNHMRARERKQKTQHLFQVCWGVVRVFTGVLITGCMAGGLGRNRAERPCSVHFAEHQRESSEEQEASSASMCTFLIIHHGSMRFIYQFHVWGWGFSLSMSLFLSLFVSTTTLHQCI